ncbi:MAG: glutamine--fructose-6-phosphate transaminase (isomerizing) [Synergistetes bacterium]|nr:glutamine--fructose-6-phosphate transaminase (isomerizing) [Synergistota bacterium]
MCGIVGYIGEEIEIVPFLIGGLRDLEYRGYDSAGVVFLDDGRLNVVKTEGKVNRLLNKLENRNLIHRRSTLGMGHTRWATHGAPSDDNAHPLTDSSMDFAVVHNGIIENHVELRRELQSDGYNFVSDTDTEVIVYLVKKYYRGNLLDAVRQAVKRLSGAFAVGIVSRFELDKVILVRQGSPLVVGMGSGAMYFASDVTPFLAYTNEAVFLEEKQIAVLTRGDVEVMDYDGGAVEWRSMRIEWTPEMASKGGFEHYMLKEIEEEGKVVRETLEGRVNLDGISLPELGGASVEHVGRLFIVACGTSYYAGVLGKYLIEELVGIPVEVEVASELRYRRFPVYRNDMAMFISQSGETADTLASLRLFKDRGIKTVSLVNVRSSTIDRESDVTLYLRAGPEIGVASTKAFVAQLALLYLIAFQWAKEKNALDIREYASGLLKLPYQIEEILSGKETIKGLAEKYYSFRNFLYLGRGFYYPIAMEGALKLKEISYIHAEAYPAGEMKHGPIALIDEQMPVVAVIPRGYIYGKTLSNLEETLARKAPIVAVATAGDSDIVRYTDDVMWIPRSMEIFAPVLCIVPLQLFAYHVARLRGCEIDQPRNLAKSVTVE